MKILKEIFIYSDHKDIVEVLLKTGSVNLNDKNSDNNTALIYAAMNGNFEIENIKIDRYLCIEIIKTKSFI